MQGVGEPLHLGGQPVALGFHARFLDPQARELFASLLVAHLLLANHVGVGGLLFLVFLHLRGIAVALGRELSQLSRDSFVLRH